MVSFSTVLILFGVISDYATRQTIPEMTTLNRLITTDVSVLSKEKIDHKDTAMWLMELEAWAHTNGMHPYIFSAYRPVDGAAPEDEAVRLQDAFRYLIKSIGNTIFRNEIINLEQQADQPSRTYAAVQHIREK